MNNSFLALLALAPAEGRAPASDIICEATTLLHGLAALLSTGGGSLCVWHRHGRGAVAGSLVIASVDLIHLSDEMPREKDAYWVRGFQFAMQFVVRVCCVPFFWETYMR